MHREAAYPWWGSYSVSQRLVGFGESAGFKLSKNFVFDDVLMVHLSWLWAPFTSQTHLVRLWRFRSVWKPLARGHIVGEMVSTTTGQNPNSIPITILSAAKIVPHARYELRTTLYLIWDDSRTVTRRLIWIWAFDLFSDEHYRRLGGRRVTQTRTHTPSSSCWKWFLQELWHFEFLMDALTELCYGSMLWDDNLVT